MTGTTELVIQNPYSNAGQATVNGFSNNLPYSGNVPIEELNRTIASGEATASVAHEITPFSAVHPDVARKRNPIRATDEESVTLGPAQEIGPRQHANARTLLRAKKKR